MTVIGVLFVLAYVSSYRVRDKLWVMYYDLRYNTKLVESEKEIDKVLARFESFPYSQLPKDYKEATLSHQKPYAGMLRTARYYKVPYKDVYTKIVGEHRIKDLMPKDAFYKDHVFGGEDIIWLIDPRVLKKLLMLEKLLIKEGYDPSHIKVVNGYRHPAYNKKVGGASQSRHIVGEAIDMSIGDVDGNGRIEKADKKVVLDLLDQKVIRSFGGIGLYPKSQSVHMDVRGYRARWDSY
ncbi:MAG: D-Ala-D-Ala carboxypeptidase family metallohydrolase [Bacteroidota bacterium]